MSLSFCLIFTNFSLVLLIKVLILICFNVLIAWVAIKFLFQNIQGKIYLQNLKSQYSIQASKPFKTLPKFVPTFYKFSTGLFSMTILYIVKFWSYCFSITQSLSTFQSLNFTPWSLFTKTSFNVSLFKELFLRYIEPQTSMRALLRKLMITAFLLDLKDPLFGFLWSSEELSCSTSPISWCWYLLIWKTKVNQ